MQVNLVDIQCILHLLNKIGTGGFTFRRPSLKAPKDPLLSAVLSNYYHHETSCLHSDMNGAAKTQKSSKSICPSKSSGLNFADLIKFVKHLRCCLIFQITHNFAFCTPSQITLRNFSLSQSCIFTTAFTVLLEAELLFESSSLLTV